MKFIITILLGCALFVSCSSKEESAASVAQEWCDLNGKVAQAKTDEERTAAEKARTDYENKMQEKYKDNQAFLDEVGKEVEKCEDASENRN